MTHNPKIRPDNPAPDRETAAEAAAPATPAELGSLAELGAWLLRARESQGISRSEISSKTKINMDQLANMEAGTFTGLAPVYAKGFIRSYAMNVNLDPADLIAAYKRIAGQADNDLRKPLTAKYKEIDLAGDEGMSLTGTFLVILAVLAVATLLAIFNTNFHNFAARILPFVDTVETAAPATATPAEPAPAAAVRVPPPAAQSPAGATATVAETIPAAETIAGTPPGTAAETPAATPAAAPEAAAAAPLPESGGRLTLIAQKATWAQVTVD
ncbi:MAG: helix-turn-helix domain-containing protein, partial [Deltaproteobacteria bacterium]|nr:helix-turn-helix domain-containing protein [Deltaproteobacteria bacterium]